MVHSDGIWIFYVNTCGCSTLTHWPSFLLHFWVFYLYDVVEKVACPSLQDLHVATHRGGSRILCWGRGAWGSGSAPPDNFENIDGKMEHSNAIWNANLELQRQVKNKIERIFLHYLKPFGITENILKTKVHTDVIWNGREFFENKDSKGIWKNWELQRRIQKQGR